MPSKAELVCVYPGHVAELWPHASRFVRDAVLRAGVSDFQEIEGDVLAGRLLLWLAWNSEIEAVATTQLSTANGRKTCTIVTCSGEGDWPDLINGIEDYARAEGCEAVRIIGRKGWKRVLPRYSEKLVVLEKRLG